MDCMELSRPEYWSGEPFPSLGDLPNPGTEPRSPSLEADSLPTEPPGKLVNPASRKLEASESREWEAYPFSRGSSQPRNQTEVSCIAGGFFTT